MTEHEVPLVTICREVHGGREVVVVRTYRPDVLPPGHSIDLSYHLDVS